MNLMAPIRELKSSMKTGKWTSERLEAWTGGRWIRTPDHAFNGVTQDTHTLSEGDLYVAIRGEHHDGHDFVNEALRAGASGALVDRDWPARVDAPVACLVVDDTLAALNALAFSHRAQWSTEVVGITGSVGKTTVKELVANMLSSVGPTSRTLGNYNNQIGVPLSLLAGRGDEAFGVFELGMNQPNEIAGLSDLIQPMVGIMTPVGAAHAANFLNEEGIAREKASMLERVNRSGFCVLSADLPWFDLFSKSCSAPFVTVALQGPADWTGHWVDGEFEIKLEGHTVLSCRLPVDAEFMARNALLATAAACRLGVKVEDIKKQIEAFQAPGMRWCRSSWNGIEVVNDSYNANPLSMQAALSALNQLPVEGTRWAVLAEMHELGEGSQAAHEELGGSLHYHACNCIALGDAADWIASGARRVGLDAPKIQTATTMEQAVDLLTAQVKPGDAVLFKASRAEQLETLIEAWQGASSD